MTAPQRDQLGDPPVQQAAVNYSLVINLKIAKALGLEPLMSVWRPA
jgi:hypothetical protein